MVTWISIAPRVKDGSDQDLLIRAFFIILVISCLTGCTPKDEVKEIKIQWESNQAIGLVLPLTEKPSDSLQSLLTVHLSNEVEQPPIIGKTKIIDNQLVFEPLIPFTRGLTYEIRYRKNYWNKISIPNSTNEQVPELLNIYPTQDTLPENLLKIYLEFSTSMREDQSLSHLFLIKNNKDTVSSAFLPLQQELWNSTRTILTVWLHPGRIKRDLQPNLNQGAPLQQGDHYELIVDKDWEDIHGQKIKKSFSKKFNVIGKDSLQIKSEKWSLSIPAEGSKQALNVLFGESLVYTLLKESIEIYTPEDLRISGKVNILREETGIAFFPDEGWKKGKYIIRIQSFLEDLAGNNLNHPFDRDLSKKTINPDKDIYKVEFQLN